MRAINVPTLGPRYWVAISLASVFGANMGDFVSNVLGLGHASGLGPLAVVLAVILLLERRARVGSEAITGSRSSRCGPRRPTWPTSAPTIFG